MTSSVGIVLDPVRSDAGAMARRLPLVGRRRTVECLRCGALRRVGHVEGECSACGYVGWKPGHRRLALAPLTGRAV